MTLKKKYFRNRLLYWDKMLNCRDMPWKGEKDPYKIWLSEIILQQTRVEQGWKYYTRIVEAFPTIQSLSKAPEVKLFKLWEGLGYYNRCKNLIATAKRIVKDRKGVFPDNYDEILSLKGVGPYTAAAISSFAFNQPYAVMDGNVSRVLARFFGIEEAIDGSKGKKLFTQLAGELLDIAEPGIYNQALMDFGAVVCKPKQPLCSTCPLINNCTAHARGSVQSLPVKAKKIRNKNRWFYYLIAFHKDKVYVRKRIKNDIWENLYEFILIEKTRAISFEKLMTEPELTKLFRNCSIDVQALSAIHRQKLTHQTIRGRFIRLRISNVLRNSVYQGVAVDQLAMLPFPNFINRYLAEYPE